MDCHGCQCDVSACAAREVADLAHQRHFSALHGRKKRLVQMSGTSTGKGGFSLTNAWHAHVYSPTAYITFIIAIIPPLTAAVMMRRIPHNYLHVSPTAITTIPTTVAAGM
eukprot:scaffold61594_cov22-Tisochrysis_lutea.AAC.4